MSGHADPLKCCDQDCAGANNCSVGGYQCADCGLWFCISDLDADMCCFDCAKRRKEEREEEGEEE